MIRTALLALAVCFGAIAPASAQETPELESWQASSPRSGPWAQDMAALTSAYESGDLRSLETLLARSRGKFEQRFGRASPPYAETLMLEGLLLWELGYQAEAIPYFRESGRLYFAALGQHRDVALAFTTCADALIDTYGNGRAAEAEEYYRRALAMRIDVLPQGAIELVSSRVDLAQLLLRRHQQESGDDRLAEAHRLASEAAQMTSPDHAEVFIDANVLLADSFVRQGAPEQAEAALRTALNRLSAASASQRHASAAPLQDALISHLEAQGKNAEADLVRAIRFTSAESDL